MSASGGKKPDDKDKKDHKSDPKKDPAAHLAAAKKHIHGVPRSAYQPSQITARGSNLKIRNPKAGDLIPSSGHTLNSSAANKAAQSEAAAARPSPMSRFALMGRNMNAVARGRSRSQEPNKIKKPSKRSSTP